MGLAGRKQKQRIPVDPRNLSWADDASRFGFSYLSKFGWDASKGLGSSGDGMKTHLKVQQRLDMMGIGAQHQRDPNGIAWKQNKEFEALLKRLNESAGHGKGADDEEGEGEGEGEATRMRETAVGETFVHARQEEVDERRQSEPSVKRKREDGDDPCARENARKKQKKEKHEKPSLSDVAQATSKPSSLSKPHCGPTIESRPMAHRTRIRAAKRIADKSASAIAEILGIAPSTSSSTSSAPTPPSSITPAPQPSLLLDNLTASTKSVADYFKEKLIARSSASSSPRSSSGFATPRLGAVSAGPKISGHDEDEVPRRGIGSQAPIIPLPTQVPEAGSTFAGDVNHADGGNVLTEKQHRKAKRKVEKRKSQAAEISPRDVSSAIKEQMNEHGAESAQRMPEKEKKDDSDASSDPFPVHKKKSKKERKKDER